MLQVFLTVDTEIWPASSAIFTAPGNAAVPGLEGAISAYFDGRTPDGDYGVPFQLEVLRHHGLRATYFVEPLFSRVAGRHHLVRMVETIQGAGQNVQLHVHPEWVRIARGPGHSEEVRLLLREHSEDDQASIIRFAAEVLHDAGAKDLSAFRAGSYGANRATLRALAKSGIRLDSSLNLAHLGGACDIQTPKPMLQPAMIEGVGEIPITCFEDRPGHQRPLQPCACSAQETEAALVNAARAGWRSIVIVLHSVELLRRTPDMAVTGTGRASSIVIRRFDRLCRFLSQHRDVFRTVTFNEVDDELFQSTSSPPALRSNIARTAWRYVEQTATRFI
jgi:hypothetical protein